MISGIYYSKEWNACCIAWEVYKCCKQVTTTCVIGYYEVCGVALEGPEGSMLVDYDWFIKAFEFIGEL